MHGMVVTEHKKQPVFLDMPDPVVFDRSVKIQIARCGINFSDLLMIRGTYQNTPDLPFALGMECAGIVIECGGDVTEFKPGDRVAAFCGHGGLAETCVVAANRVFHIPDALGFDIAASMLITYGTSLWALKDRAMIKQGDHVAITGAAGGIGIAAIQLAKTLGARVTGFASTPEKCDFSKSHGADDCFVPAELDAKKQLQDAGGIDILFDAVGGDEFMACYRALKPEGCALLVGFASGDVPQIPANILMVKNLNVMGINWGAAFQYAPGAIAQTMAELFDLVITGQLTPPDPAILPFSETIVALERVKTRQAKGKMVIALPNL